MADQARNSRIRSLGASFAVYVRANRKALGSTTKLQSVVADILGADQSLLLPIKELIAAPAFKQLAKLAGSGTGSVQRDSAIQSLAGTFSTGVVADLEIFLGGFLDLPTKPRPAQDPASIRRAPYPVAPAARGTRTAAPTSAVLNNNNRRRPAAFGLLGAATAILAVVGWYINLSLKPVAPVEKPAVDRVTKAFTENGRSIELDHSKESGEIISGPLTVKATFLNEERDIGAPLSTPVVSVLLNNVEVARMVGSSAPDTKAAIVQLADMDPLNIYPEVIFFSHSGGTHCCWSVTVLSSDASGKKWFEVEVPLAIDGMARPARELLNNGNYYLTTTDGSFLYRYARYSCSYAPTKVFKLDGKDLIDATLEKSLIPFHTAELRRLNLGKNLENLSLQEYEDIDHPPCVNGFLAGWVATKAIIGEIESAWHTMLRLYNRSSDWGLQGENDIVYSSFPEALKAHLIRSGYIGIDIANKLRIR